MKGRARRKAPKRPRQARAWSPADPAPRDLKALLLEAIPTKAKTIVDVRKALLARLGPPSARTNPLYDDSRDVDRLIDLIATELAKRGIARKRRP